MNYLFLVNAAVLVFLGFSLYQEKRDKLTLIFLFANFSLAAWNICVFLSEESILPTWVDTISKIQLVSAMMFVNGYYQLCWSYPVINKQHPVFSLLNGLVFSVFAFFVFFTNSISEAVIENGQVVYIDHPLGYATYGAYLAFFCFGSLYVLFLNYKKYKEYRKQIKLVFSGIALFVVTAIICNALLPLFGEYRLLIIGRLSAVFPSLFFSYVIIKHSFLDISVIVNQRTAWAITFLLMVVSFIFAYAAGDINPTLQFILLLGLVVFWGVLGERCKSFLLTSVRRKFIRSWYDPDDVISEIAEQLTVEQNRAAIFQTLSQVLEEVFQLEKSKIIVAVRDDEEKLSHYAELPVMGSIADGVPLDNTNLVDQYQRQRNPDYLDNCETEVKKYLIEEGFKENHQCMLVPFYSPELLEGIVVMGERSDQMPFNDRDLRFMFRLVNYISAILYRLTPFEKLEKLYFENRERLHEAEIQLIRAQKIEAIAHATRQCHHEIRTPLNIIRLGIGRIKSMDDLESYKKYANEEISRALEIVDETLTITDVSKEENDRLSSFDLNEVIRRSIRVVDLERYELDLAFDNLPNFTGNFSDMQVVIANLVHNALEAMPDGGKLAIRTYPRNKNIVVEVEDSGCGIEENLRSRVWEPYFSGKETEVGNSTAGRGWGLTIVNRIVTEHQGTIKLSSKVGEGTKFTITLPQRQAA
ncbi:MAG: hypothetical protein CMP91_01380 [Gammaproteobacteria bacterium]|nr:hypothetical protein [Gammaproteobacteria bacterium]MAY02818.1 hypothetical protein [Gammaproteobacteria bacterium]|tara:strand:- start:53188 stop:55281 length:2094 start_codon:yes stop_codon:yes gene_type:complete